MKLLLSTVVGATFALTALSAHAQLKNLTAETAGKAGVPGNVITTLGEVASQAGVANIQVLAGQTLTNSLVNAATGKTDIAAAPFILPFLLSKGVGPYAKTGKKKGAELAANVQVLYTYVFGTFALYAYDSKNFGGWDNLKGKTIYNGPPRGGALNNARAIIKIITGLDEGKGYSGVQANWGQATKTIMGGSSDAMVLPKGMPDGRLTQALAAGNITIWSFPKKKFEAKAAQTYAKAPGSAALVVPIKSMGYGKGVSVVSEDDKFRGISTVGGDLVNKSMDVATAKALTTAMIKNLKTFTSKTPFMKNVQLGEVEDIAITGMCGRFPLKYHPGAVMAWEEAGFKVPDCAKP